MANMSSLTTLKLVFAAETGSKQTIFDDPLYILIL